MINDQSLTSSHLTADMIPSLKEKNLLTVDILSDDFHSLVHWIMYNRQRGVCHPCLN